MTKDKISQGWIHKKYGYREIRVNGKTMPEHRYIMEQFLGRKLNRNELVHHIDGNRLNNAIENLEIMTLSEHTKMHMRHIGFPKLSQVEENKRKQNAAKSHSKGYQKSIRQRRDTDDIRQEHSIAMRTYWRNKH